MQPNTEGVIRDLHSGLSPAQIQQAEFRSRVLSEDGAKALFEYLEGDGVVEGLSRKATYLLIQQCDVAGAWHKARGRLEIAGEFEVWIKVLQVLFRSHPSKLGN